MKSAQTPVLFVGHGSPLNAIADNTYTKTLRTLGATLKKPKAILVVSAHWQTKGTYILGMPNPRTIYDFYGFPGKLSEIVYDAPGSPELAEKIVTLISEPKLKLDVLHWGFDHGAWSVLTHLFPEATIPTLQISLNEELDLKEHFQLGRKLRSLRDQGVLIVGSGNIIHNLQRMDWDNQTLPMEWASVFDSWVKDKLERRDFEPLLVAPLNSTEGRLSLPTLEHYLPMLYVLGASHEGEKVKFHFEEIHHGSIGMRTFSFG